MKKKSLRRARIRALVRQLEHDGIGAVGGAAVGAVVGTLAGPPGMISGAAVGALVGGVATGLVERDHRGRDAHLEAEEDEAVRDRALATPRGPVNGRRF